MGKIVLPKHLTPGFYKDRTSSVPVSIDWDNKITNGLQVAVSRHASGRNYDYVRKKFERGGTGTYSKGVGKYGEGVYLSPGSQYFETDNTLASVGEYTFIVVAEPDNVTDWFFSSIFFVTADASTTSSFGLFKNGGTGSSAAHILQHGANTAASYTHDQIVNNEVFVCRWDGSTVYFYANGEEVSSSAFSASVASTSGDLKLFSNKDTFDSEGTHYLTAIWDRCLTKAEAIEISKHPFDIFKPINDGISFTPSVATGNFTLTADSGSYTYTGTAAELAAGLVMSADSGSYTYTGTAVDLNVGFVLSADSGTYTYTGTAANLVFASPGNFTLSADSGAYTYTGNAADLKASLIMAADSGAYTYTGTAAGLDKGFTLSADSGSYVYTGTGVGFGQVYVMTADSGSYEYIGSIASITSSVDVWTVQPNDTSSWTVIT